MTYYCLNCSTIVQGQRRKYCSDKCLDEYHLKKSREKYQSVRPKNSYTKSKTCELLKCDYETLAKVVNLYSIKLDKTSTGKNEYVTQENLLLIKEKLEEYRRLPKATKGIAKATKGIAKATDRISVSQIAKEVGVSWHLVQKIIKKHNIKKKSSDKKTTFYDESTVELVKEKIKEHYDEKENYLDKMQIAVLFEYNPKDIASADSCFKYIKQRWGAPPCKPKYIKSGVDKFSSRISYPKESTLKWIEQIKSTDEWKKRPSGSKALSEEEKQKRLQQKLDEEKKFLEQTKGLIITEEAVTLLGCKSNSPLLSNTDKLPSTKKIKGKWYYEPSEILQLKQYLEEQQKEREENKQQRRPQLGKDWTTDDAYERRLWKRVQKGVPKNLTDKKDIQRWNNNKRLMKNGQLGIVKTFTCTSTCGQELPYTSFYFDAKKGNKYGREGRCKACIKARKDGGGVVKKSKTASRFATQFALSIKQELSRQNGHYIEIGNREIWENVEKYCGYTKEDFLANIKSKFNNWMSWENNKRPTEPGEKTWQLDHIVPRAKFKYTTMADPQFRKCWSLDNLEPLESQINLLKSDKSLLEACRRTFLSGLKSGESTGGIWNHLDYVPLEARQYLEEDWGERIDWDNLKDSGLEIDHIIPQAYLAFTSFEDENFRECWALTNLQILTKHNNSLKGSVHNSIHWQYNYK